jgi:hypothetical protein
VFATVKENLTDSLTDDLLEDRDDIDRTLLPFSDRLPSAFGFSISVAMVEVKRIVACVCTFQIMIGKLLNVIDIQWAITYIQII